MILTKKQIQKIKEIIETYFKGFIFQNLGPEFLDKKDLADLPSNLTTTDHFKNAYLIGKLQGNAGPEAISNKTYDQFLTEIFNRSLGQTSLDQRTLEIAKASISHYLDNLMNRTIDNIISTIHVKNREAHLEQLGESPTSFQSAERDSRTLNQLVSELRDKTQDIARDWERVVRTELAVIHNQGAVNAIVERNKESGVSKEDILVYAQGPLDDATCDNCRKHYHSGNSFKVYRLSELLANGTNIGLKSKDFKACIPPMHPRCRHRLIELLPGWTLDNNGSQKYVGPDHHELNHSIKKATISERLDLLKAKAYPIGTIRVYGSQKYIKHADGWVGLSEGKRQGKLVDFASGGKVHADHKDEVHGNFAKMNEHRLKEAPTPSSNEVKEKNKTTKDRHTNVENTLKQNKAIIEQLANKTDSKGSPIYGDKSKADPETEKRRSKIRDLTDKGNISRLPELGGVNGPLAKALDKWTGSGYSLMRQYQMNPKSMDSAGQIYNKYVKALEDSFEDLPTHEGRISRYLNLGDDVFDKLFKEGSTYTTEAFSSFTEHDELPDFDGNIRLIVAENKSGKRLGSLSQHPHEKEVLVPKGVKYKVDHIKDHGRTKMVWLSEVEE